MDTELPLYTQAHTRTHTGIYTCEHTRTVRREGGKEGEKGERREDYGNW